MDKRLITTRNDIYKKCPSIFWEVSIFAIIIAIALTALETVVPGLYLITFSFIFFPLLFATFMTLYTIKFGGTVTIGSTFKIARSYFKRNNFGCFRLIRNFLMALLVNIAASFIMMLVVHYVFVGIYGSAFTDSFQKVIDLLTNDPDTLLVYLEEYSTGKLNEANLAFFYYDFVSSISLSISILSFVYFVTYSSVNVYLCANIPNASASFVGVVYNKFNRTNKKIYFKDFISLNWPLFVLFLLGQVIGYALVFILNLEFKFAQPISTMIGIACLIPFAPFFFANMEALFNKYNEKMRKASMELTQGFLKNLKNNVNLSEEDKAKIDELLSKENDENNAKD